MSDETHDMMRSSRKTQNDIKPLKSLKQLETLQLDLNSPRLQKALKNLGLTKANLKPKSVDVTDDLSELRFKHFQNKLLDTVNKVLIERNNIKLQDYRDLLAQMNINLEKKKGRKNSTSNLLDPTFITATGSVPGHSSAVSFYKAPSEKPRFDKTRSKRSQGALMAMSMPLFPEKKLRDKTEEVRERRTQKFLDEDEFARKKMIAIKEKMK